MLQIVADDGSSQEVNTVSVRISHLEPKGGYPPFVGGEKKSKLGCHFN